jgi:predicted dinucleotide-binding enzyme
MKIAIIGAGSVGKTLGTGLRAKGHTIVYGTRDPAKAGIGAPRPSPARCRARTR